MDRAIIDTLLAEEADLIRKLDAVRAVLKAYGVAPSTASAPRPSVSPSYPPRSTSSGTRQRVGLDRFSDYGRSVIEAALAVITEEGSGLPIPTRTLVDRIEKRGLVIRGEDMANALSALLARSSDVQSNGRRGWTLAQHQNGQEPTKNEPPSGAPADGSETDGEDAPTSDPSPFNP